MSSAQAWHSLRSRRSNTLTVGGSVLNAIPVEQVRKQLIVPNWTLSIEKGSLHSSLISTMLFVSFKQVFTGLSSLIITLSSFIALRSSTLLTFLQLLGVYETILVVLIVLPNADLLQLFQCLTRTIRFQQFHLRTVVVDSAIYLRRFCRSYSKVSTTIFLTNSFVPRWSFLLSIHLV